MARNSDGTVTVKTPGKLASTPRGSGTGIVKTTAAKSSTKTTVVRKLPGRGPVGRSAAAH